MAKSRTVNYLKAVGSAYLVRIVGVLTGFWLTPFIIRRVSPSEYGILVLTGDVMMWLGLLDLGIAAGLRVQAAQLVGAAQRRRLEQLFTSALLAQSITAFLVLVAGFGVAALFPVIFRVPVSLLPVCRPMVLSMVLGVVLTLPERVFAAVLVSRQEAHVDNLLRLLSLVISTTLTVILLENGWGVVSVPVAGIPAACVLAGLAGARVFRLLPGMRLRIADCSFGAIRSMGVFGTWLSVGALSNVLINYLDRAVAGSRISLSAVSALHLTSRTYTLASTAIVELSGAARPMIGELVGAGKTASVQRVFAQLQRLSTGCALLVAASLWAANGCFVKRWVGPANYAGWPVDLICAVNLVIRSWTLPCGITLTAAMLAIPRQAVCRLVEGAVNFGLSVLLASRLGVFGVVLGTTLAALSTSSWYLPKLMAERLAVASAWRPGRSARGCFFGVAGLFVVGSIIRWFAQAIGGFRGAFLGALLTFSVGLFTLWHCYFDPALKARFHDLVRRLEGRRLLLVFMRAERTVNQGSQARGASL